MCVSGFIITSFLVPGRSRPVPLMTYTMLFLIVFPLLCYAGGDRDERFSVTFFDGYGARIDLSTFCDGPTAVYLDGALVSVFFVWSRLILALDIVSTFLGFLTGLTRV